MDYDRLVAYQQYLDSNAIWVGRSLTINMVEVLANVSKSSSPPALGSDSCGNPHASLPVAMIVAWHYDDFLTIKAIQQVSKFFDFHVIII